MREAGRRASSVAPRGRAASRDARSIGPDRARRWGGLRTALVALAFGPVLVTAGCDRQGKPVIPRAAYTERTTRREAVEGRDTTWARLTYPEFVGARTPEALDSLRAMVNALLVAPAGGRGGGATGAIALMDGFISEWNSQRKATRSRAYWRLERRVEVLAETLGVVSFAASEFLYQGGAHSMSTVRLVNIDADRGHTLRFGDLFREESRDSLSAALEPLFREARGIAADSSLRNMGFAFEDDRFHAGDNLAVTADGVRWHFNPYEIAPYAWGPTDFVAPFEMLREFARADGPLRRGRK